MEVDQFISKMRNIRPFLTKSWQKIMLSLDSDIVNLQNEQLMAGKNVEGKTMQKGYSKPYAKKRTKAGLQTGFVDLRFTGKYQDTKHLFKKQEGIDIRSAADYEPHLRANFPNHVGLNEKNAEVIAEKVATQLAVEIEKYLSR